jgi:hypothetical protein
MNDRTFILTDLIGSYDFCEEAEWNTIRDQFPGWSSSFWFCYMALVGRLIGYLFR